MLSAGRWVKDDVAGHVMCCTPAWLVQSLGQQNVRLLLLGGQAATGPTPSSDPAWLGATP